MERECSEAPQPVTPVSCRLRLDHIASQRVALPQLPLLLLLTHLCSMGRHIMSPRNPLKKDEPQ